MVAVADIQIEGTFRSAGTLPPFRGATLRGALGHHLRKTVCTDLRRSCAACFLATSCAYSTFFNGTASTDRDFMRLYPYVPQPFMLLVQWQDPCSVTEGEVYRYGIRLFGHTEGLFPYVAYALLQAGETGLGKDRLRYDILRIAQGDNVLYEVGGNRISKPVGEDIVWSNTTEPSDLRLSFLTPVRIRSRGQTAEALQLRQVIAAALRRISIMNYFYGSGAPLDKDFVGRCMEQSSQIHVAADDTTYVSFTRHSGRQQNRVPMDGLVGHLDFVSVPPKLIDILRLAERIGLGKSTSFGFGNIRLDYV